MPRRGVRAGTANASRHAAQRFLTSLHGPPSTDRSAPRWDLTSSAAHAQPGNSFRKGEGGGPGAAGPPPHTDREGHFCIGSGSSCDLAARRARTRTDFTMRSTQRSVTGAQTYAMASPACTGRYRGRERQLSALSNIVGVSCLEPRGRGPSRLLTSEAHRGWIESAICAQSDSRRDRQGWRRADLISGMRRAQGRMDCAVQTIARGRIDEPALDLRGWRGGLSRAGYLSNFRKARALHI